MKLFTVTKFVWPIGLSVAMTGGTALAYTHEASTKAPSPERCPSMTPEGPGSEEAESREHASGVLELVGGALQKVCLSQEQRDAVEKIGERVSAKEEAVTEASGALRSAVLEQLKSGEEVDEEALAEQIDAVVKAREEASPVFRKGLEDLHGILEPDQRAAFVDAMESSLRELRKDSEGWLDGLARDLKLTADQKRRIGDVLEEAKPHADEECARMAKVLEEFKKDEFSIEHIVPVGDVGQRSRERAEGMIGIVKELTSILSPEQRVELANRLATKSTKRGHGSGHGTTADGGEALAETQQSIVFGGGYRMGGVRGWGYSSGYTRRSFMARGISTGYAMGYPLVGGYGPGIW